ncbi:phage filamentation protein Fil family protein [Ewingella allii]
MAISIAPLLKQQSAARHFGHGWIELPGGGH